MVSLIALLSSGKGTWAQVNSLISSTNFSRIYFICNDYAFKNFEVKNQKVVKLLFDDKKPIETMNKLSKFFKADVKDFEVAVNLSSGTGTEHMVVLSSILKAGLGLRFVDFQNNDFIEYDLLEQDYTNLDDLNSF